MSPKRRSARTKTTAYLEGLARDHRLARALARPLTPLQLDALQAARREGGAAIHPHGVTPGYEFGAITYSVAVALTRAGLTTMTCRVDQEGLTLTRHGTWMDGGLLHITAEGVTRLRAEHQADRSLTLAPAGQMTRATEHGLHVDGPDPLEAGEYVSPDDVGISPDRARRSQAQHQDARGWQRRRAA